MCEGDLEVKTAAATGTSVRTLQRIKKEVKEGGVLSPSSKRKRVSPITENVNAFDEGRIRREILSFLERGESPTLSMILKKVKEPPVSFSGSQTSLYKLLKMIGFSFKKAKRGRKILMEKDEIVAARCRYLRILTELRNSTNPPYEVYLDEVWVTQNEAAKICCSTSDGKVGPKLKSGKGAHFIIHAGGDNGFVPGAFLMLKPEKGNKGNSCDPMHAERFLAWFTEQLIPNIPPGSVIIMDEAPYHSKLLNKAPSESSGKCDIITWLQQNNIPHDSSHFKCELLHIVNTNKDKEMDEIDQIALSHGHTILRLPPHHCDLNPIERVWAQMKKNVRKDNAGANQTVKRVEEPARGAVDQITAEHWRMFLRDTRTIEEEYKSKDEAVNLMYENLVLPLPASDSDEDDYE